MVEEEKKKFKVGDKVWFVNENKPRKSEVAEVHHRGMFQAVDVVGCRYIVFNPDDLHHTSGDLLKHIEKEINELEL